MKIVILLLIIYLTCPIDAGTGYEDIIKIGNNHCIVGFELDQGEYPSTKLFNLNNDSNPNTVNFQLQEALNFISRNGGGVVHIKGGIYESASLVDIYGSKVHVTGDGIDKTIIKLTDNARSFIDGTKKKSGFLRTQNTTDIIISNLTLDGNKANQGIDLNSTYGRYGIFTEACTNVWFDNVRVTNFQGYGFDPHGWKTRGLWGVNLTITNCISDNNNYDGFTIDQTNYNYISNCSSYKNGRHGYNIVTGSRFTTITNCTSIDNGFYDPFGGSGCGYMAQNNVFKGTSYVTIVDSIAINNKKSSLCLNNVSNITFTRNQVNVSRYCFGVVLTSSTAIFDNVCYARRYYQSVNSAIVYNVGVRPNVYIYNNFYNGLYYYIKQNVSLNDTSFVLEPDDNNYPVEINDDDPILYPNTTNPIPEPIFVPEYVPEPEPELVTTIGSTNSTNDGIRINNGLTDIGVLLILMCIFY